MKSKRAFSLIEIICVLLILSALGTLSFSLIHTSDAQKLQAESKSIQSLIEHARQRAWQLRMPCGIAIHTDPTQETCTLYFISVPHLQSLTQSPIVVEEWKMPYVCRDNVLFSQDDLPLFDSITKSQYSIKLDTGAALTCFLFMISPESKILMPEGNQPVCLPLMLKNKPSDTRKIIVQRSFAKAYELE